MGGEEVALSPDEAAKACAQLAEGLELDQNVDGSKAARHLGWTPRHGGFVDGVAEYLISWQASLAPAGGAT